jgi:ferredoxin
MMGMSAAAKNMFGVVPGTIKPEYHFRYPDPADFARMIVDLNEYFKPCLSIVDAVVGMEGNGPTQGTPRSIGAIAASPSPHMLDLLCARLIGLGPDNVPTLQAAIERGLIPPSLDELNVVGEYDSLCIKDFNNVAVRTSLLFDNRSRLFGKIARSALESRPKIKKAECRSCKKCYELCPARAISMKGGKPTIDRSACIRCFCCQEFCPFGAIKVHRPLPALLLTKGSRGSK